jgi:hypothetical protein
MKRLILLALFFIGTATADPADFDLVWDAVDPNGIPLNPRWATRFPDPVQLCNGFRPSGDGTSLGSPPCTTQSVSFDGPTSFYGIAACDVLGPAFKGGAPPRGGMDWACQLANGHVSYNANILGRTLKLVL